MSDDAEQGDASAARRRHRKRRRKQEAREARHAIKLLSHAALGKAARVERLLRKHADLDINLTDTDGLSSLHMAAMHGHTETAALLLRLGADARADDSSGSTPAHWAARGSHLATLAALLQACPSLSLDRCNAAGESVRALMQAAIQRTAGGARLHGSPASPAASQPEPDSEEEWRAKLRDNAGLDDFEKADWDSAAGSDGGGAPGPEDEDAYARRMWEGMQRRRAGAAPGPTPAAAEAWAAADSAADRKRRAWAAAAERSRRILEEEQARDRAWREAVARGDLGARRAAYEARWAVFAGGSGPVTFDEVPWLVADQADARAVVLHGTAGAAEERRRLRAELMRWHPDKFTARFGGRVVPADRARVAERVKAVSQMLNQLGQARGE